MHHIMQTEHIYSPQHRKISNMQLPENIATINHYFNSFFDPETFEFSLERDYF